MNWILMVPVAVCAMYAGNLSGIREHYGSVKDMIDAGNQLYLSSLEINSQGMMYPALGTYGRSFQFYWMIDEEDYPSSSLVFISVTSQYAAVEEYEEFLFDGSGKLEFYFISGGYDMTEERYYFDEETLFRYGREDQYTNHPDAESVEEGDMIILEAERLFQAFDLTH